MRLNPNFVTNVFANNLKAIFDYIEGLDTPNQRLEDVGVELQHISLKVISTKNKMPIDITLDEEDQLIQLDIKDLTIRGSAILLTQGSKTNERVTIEAPLDNAII
jgi:hypothetical protein